MTEEGGSDAGSGDDDDGGGIAADALDLVKGVMGTVEALVVCLGKTGVLDGAEYARLLTDWRAHFARPGSLTEVPIDQMLSILVDEPQVLIRRMGMQLVPPGQDEPLPTPPLPGHEGPDGA